MFGPNVRFLLVDDFSSMRKTIKKVLMESGFQNFVEASDGKNALEVIAAGLKENQPIEFIISDWNMPVMRGIDLLRACRADPQTKNIPFILVTAESEPAQIMEAIAAGVSDYVIKPFTPKTIKTKIEKVYAQILKKGA